MIYDDVWVGPNRVKVIVRVGTMRTVDKPAAQVVHALSNPANYTIIKKHVEFKSTALNTAYLKALATWKACYPGWEDQFDAAVMLLVEHHTDWVPFTFAELGREVNYACLRTRFLAISSAYIVQALGNLTLPVWVPPTASGREYWVYFCK
jgi:hypothetical protein